VKLLPIAILAGIILAGCSACVPGKVKEVILEGDVASQRMVNLIGAGNVTKDQLEQWAIAERALWGKLKSAIEE